MAATCRVDGANAGKISSNILQPGAESWLGGRPRIVGRVSVFHALLGADAAPYEFELGHAEVATISIYGFFAGAIMNAHSQALIEQAKQLTALEKLEVVDALLASVDKPDPEIDRLWAVEVEDRLAAYRRGEIKALELNEVLAKYSKA